MKRKVRGDSERLLFLGGGFLVAAAWIVLTLVVMGIIPSSFVLSIGAYAGSVLGLCMGAIGAVSRHESNKRKKQRSSESGESATDTLLRSYSQEPTDFFSDTSDSSFHKSS